MGVNCMLNTTGYGEWLLIDVQMKSFFSFNVYIFATSAYGQGSPPGFKTEDTCSVISVTPFTVTFNEQQRIARPYSGKPF